MRWEIPSINNDLALEVVIASPLSNANVRFSADGMDVTLIFDDYTLLCRVGEILIEAAREMEKANG